MLDNLIISAKIGNSDAVNAWRFGGLETKQQRVKVDIIQRWKKSRSCDDIVESDGRISAFTRKGCKKTVEISYNS